MKFWPVQDAEAQFGELLDVCVSDGLQLVTKRDTETAVTAVLVPIADWRRMSESARPTPKGLLLSDDARGSPQPAIAGRGSPHDRHAERARLPPLRGPGIQYIQGLIDTVRLAEP